MKLLPIYSPINRINSLIKDLENQLAVTSSHIENDADKWTLLNDLTAHNIIHIDLLYVFSKSEEARVSLFKGFGNNVRMHDILQASKEIVSKLHTKIQQIINPQSR